MPRLHANPPSFIDADPIRALSLTPEERHVRLIEAEHDFFALLWKVYATEDLSDTSGWVDQVYDAAAMVQYWRSLEREAESAFEENADSRTA